MVKLSSGWNTRGEGSRVSRVNVIVAPYKSRLIAEEYGVRPYIKTSVAAVICGRGNRRREKLDGRNYYPENATLLRNICFRKMARFFFFPWCILLSSESLESLSLRNQSCCPFGCWDGIGYIGRVARLSFIRCNYEAYMDFILFLDKYNTYLSIRQIIKTLLSRRLRCKGFFLPIRNYRYY